MLDFKISPMPSGEVTPWMALEWIDGETLAHALDARRGRGGRSPREALALLEPVFDALAMAHARGVAHRDVKPANIMLPSGERAGRFGVAARLLDFGIAKTTDPTTTSTGNTETTSPFQAYSLPYASSEQVSGMRSGPCTDVHALALILVELLTDAPPFAPGDRSALMQQVLSPSRPTPARHGVDVGPWEPVLARALSLQASERYAHAGEFLAALEQAIADVHTSARRSPAPPAPAQVSIAPTRVPDGSVDASATALGSTTAPIVNTHSRHARACSRLTLGLAAFGVMTLCLAGGLALRGMRRPHTPPAQSWVRTTATAAPLPSPAPPPATPLPAAPPPAPAALPAPVAPPTTHLRTDARARIDG